MYFVWDDDECIGIYIRGVKHPGGVLETKTFISRRVLAERIIYIIPPTVLEITNPAIHHYVPHDYLYQYLQQSKVTTLNMVLYKFTTEKG